MNETQPKRISGTVPVLVMAFNSDGAVDEDSLRRQIDFCVEAGAQGIAFGIGSESGTLTDAERIQVWTLAARHLDGKRPLVAATSHASREGTIALTHLARECGVDCAMVNPAPRSGEQLVGLFRDLSERVALPLMIQDVGQNAPADVLLQASQEGTQVISLKIESPGAPHKIGQIVSGLKQNGLNNKDGEKGSEISGESREITVLGGANGNLLPEELQRGSVGTIPFPAIIDAYQSVCEQYAAGEATSGWETYVRCILPLLRAASAGSGNGNAAIWLHKTIFQRAGILQTAHCRMDISPLPNWVVEGVWRHLTEADLHVSRCFR